MDNLQHSIKLMVINHKIIPTQIILINFLLILNIIDLIDGKILVLLELFLLAFDVLEKRVYFLHQILFYVAVAECEVFVYAYLLCYVLVELWACLSLTEVRA